MISNDDFNRQYQRWLRKKPWYAHVCISCGAPFQSHDRIADRCPPCDAEYWRYDPVAAAEWDAEQSERQRQHDAAVQADADRYN